MSSGANCCEKPSNTKSPFRDWPVQIEVHLRQFVSLEPGGSACCYWNRYESSATTRLKDLPQVEADLGAGLGRRLGRAVGGDDDLLDLDHLLERSCVRAVRGLCEGCAEGCACGGLCEGCVRVV